jgi:hypothetical protein
MSDTQFKITEKATYFSNEELGPYVVHHIYRDINNRRVNQYYPGLAQSSAKNLCLALGGSFQRTEDPEKFITLCDIEN